MAPSELSHLSERGDLRMVPVGQKPPTERHAVAEGFLMVTAAVMATVRDGTTPKGDVFAAARLAGIAAAKRTSELIPLCHLIPLSHVAVDFEPLADRIRIIGSASANAATGVEMEALTAVTAAALTLYDMLKAVSHEMVISDVRLLEKRGGKSDYSAPAKPAEIGLSGSHSSCDSHVSHGHGPIRAAVLTVSDRCSAGTATDTAGPAVAELLANRLGANIEWRGLVPDETDQISAKRDQLATLGLHLIVTVGGTGCAPRDVTPEATRAVIAREVPGLSEVMRMMSRQYTPHASLQRGLCGIRDSSLIVNLPGSERAATQNLTAILPGLCHAMELIQGAVSSTGARDRRGN